MKDLLLNNPDLLDLVLTEKNRQINKWGIQDHSPFEWLTFTTEEVGELARAISEHHYRGGLQSNVVKEAIHAATLCLTVAEMYLEDLK